MATCRRCWHHESSRNIFLCTHRQTCTFFWHDPRAWQNNHHLLPWTGLMQKQMMQQSRQQHRIQVGCNRSCKMVLGRSYLLVLTMSYDPQHHFQPKRWKRQIKLRYEVSTLTHFKYQCLRWGLDVTNLGIILIVWDMTLDKVIGSPFDSIQ